jgi:hypothetical protein
VVPNVYLWSVLGVVGVLLQAGVTVSVVVSPLTTPFARRVVARVFTGLSSWEVVGVFLSAALVL